MQWKYLTDTEVNIFGGLLGMVTYGGKVNSLAPDVTATAHRNSIISSACSVGWSEPADEAGCMAWIRAFYSELFADSGGVPVPDEYSDGAMINHPDTDLAHPDWNRSRVPWHTLYYKDNYPRLQRVKANRDPLNIFHHAISIRPSGMSQTYP